LRAVVLGHNINNNQFNININNNINNNERAFGMTCSVFCRDAFF
jgi:hypothetical protein